MRQRLTFEFRTPEGAQWYLDRVDGQGRRSHRVVDVECCSPAGDRMARELAAQMGGSEGTPEPTFLCSEDAPTDPPWTLAHFAAVNAEDLNLPDWIEQLSSLRVGDAVQLDFQKIRRLT